MDKIKQLLVNKFPQFYNEGMSTYEVIAKIVYYLNQCIDGVNNIDDKLYEFVHWFDNLGIQDEVNQKLNEMEADGSLAEIINEQLLSTIQSKLTSIEATHTTITNNINTLSTEVNKFKNIKNGLIYVNDHPLYNKDNVSPSLNAILQNLNEGDTVILNDGIVTMLDPVVINASKNCTINLNAIFKTSGDIVAFKIKGDNGARDIYIKQVEGNVSGYKTATGTGIRITGGFSAQIKIDEVKGFNKGIHMYCEDNGIQYMRITFQNIKSCVYGIYYDALDKWINECTWYCGMIGCDTAIKSVAPVGGGEYNNNRFINPGFEYVSDHCVDVTNFRYNLFTGCRLMENHPTTNGFIETNSWGNFYQFNSYVRISNFKLAMYSSIEGLLMDDGENILGYKGRSKYHEDGNKIVIEQVSDTNCVPRATMESLEGVKAVYTLAYKMTEIRLGDINGFLEIPSYYNYEGFTLDIRFQHSSGLTGATLTVNLPNGESKTITADGIYRLYRTDNYWSLIQISI